MKKILFGLLICLCIDPLLSQTIYPHQVDGEIYVKFTKSALKDVSKEDPNLLRPVDVTLQIPSVDKFYEKTNWKPKYTLEDSVKLLLDYYRNQ